MGDATTVRAGTDNFVDQAQSSRNFEPTRKALRLDGSANKKYAYLHLRQPFDPGETVTSAKLHIVCRGGWAGTTTITAKRITESWKAGAITFDNKPAVSSTNSAASTRTGMADGDVIELNLQAMLQQVSDGAPWYGIRLEIDTAAVRELNSVDSLDGKPSLDVAWSDAPQAPTVLAPSGGRAVGVAKPVLRCDFTDNAGSDAMTAINVQIDAAGDFVTGVDFDSGTVAATEPELDLATTAYAGLADGGTTSWRVRVQDGAGLWSAWSDPDTFKRDNKGTLAVSSPSSGSPVIRERTPPIVFTLTGETMSAYQIIVRDAADPTIEFYDSGKTKNTALTGVAVTKTLPKSSIPDDSTTYELTVRVWDTKDREATPGDPRYVEVVRQFTYVESGSPGVVTSLAATNPTPTPFVDLTWSRATAPDYFVVLRRKHTDDDSAKWVVVEEELLPGDATTGGTGYAFTDYDAPAYVRSDYSVQACVRGTGCSNKATVTITPKSKGIWISDPDRPSLYVFLSGDQGNFTATDGAAVFKTLGDETAARIVSAVSALEGSIAGRLIDLNGFSADEWEDRMNTVKGRGNQVYRVHIDDFVMRCLIGDVVISPSTTGLGVREVSFSYWQQPPLPFESRR